MCYFAGVLDAGCKKVRRYVILKAVQGHMINMALFYHVYEVGVKTPGFDACRMFRAAQASERRGKEKCI